MAARKEIRSDNTYIISTDDTDNPKLGAKILSDGRESLFLDYYLGYKMVYDEDKDPAQHGVHQRSAGALQPPPQIGRAHV